MSLQLEENAYEEQRGRTKRKRSNSFDVNQLFNNEEYEQSASEDMDSPALPTVDHELKVKRKAKEDDYDPASFIEDDDDEYRPYSPSPSPSSKQTRKTKKVKGANGTTGSPKQRRCSFKNCAMCKNPESFKLEEGSGWRELVIATFKSIYAMNSKKGKWLYLPTDVYQFVEEHWPENKPKEENWKKRLQDTLSHNKKYFASGKALFGKTGFWCLRDFDEDSDCRSPYQLSDESSSHELLDGERSTGNRKFIVELMGEIDMLRETILQLKNQLNEKTNRNLEELRSVRERMIQMEQNTNSQILQLQLELHQKNACFPLRSSVYSLTPTESELLLWNDKDDGTVRLN